MDIGNIIHLCFTTYFNIHLVFLFVWLYLLAERILICYSLPIEAEVISHLIEELHGLSMESLIFSIFIGQNHTHSYTAQLFLQLLSLPYR